MTTPTQQAQRHGARINEQALECHRPEERRGYITRNFGCSCSMHGPLVQGLETFDEVKGVFGEHVLNEHVDESGYADEAIMHLSWDDVPYGKLTLAELHAHDVYTEDHFNWERGRYRPRC